MQMIECLIKTTNTNFGTSLFLTEGPQTLVQYIKFKLYLTIEQ